VEDGLPGGRADILLSKLALCVIGINEVSFLYLFIHLFVYLLIY